MSILGGIGKIVGLEDLFGEIGKTVRQVLPNKEAQRDFDLALEGLKDKYQARLHEEVMGQLDVNKTEAGHDNVFVAGWRPFIGWVCGSGLAWNFVLAPFITTFGVAAGQLEIEGLITLVITMLGASGIRTFERVKGVSMIGTKHSTTTSTSVSASASPAMMDVVNNETTTAPTPPEDESPWPTR